MRKISVLLTFSKTKKPFPVHKTEEHNTGGRKTEEKCQLYTNYKRGKISGNGTKHN